MLIMIFTFRPCNRRAHYRKRRVPRFIVSLLLCITAVVVLLLLAPQWVLILIIAVLMFCICFISR